MKKPMQFLAALLTLCAAVSVAAQTTEKPALDTPEKRELALKKGLETSPSEIITYKKIVTQAEYEAQQKRDSSFQFSTQEIGELTILEQLSAGDIAYFAQKKRVAEDKPEYHKETRKLARQLAVRARMAAGDEKIIYKIVTDELGFAAAQKAKTEFHFSKIMMGNFISKVERSKAELEADKVGDLPMNVKVGDLFPSFTSDSNQGRSFSNISFKNKLTVINFFFDKCAPCIQETPELNAFAKNNPQVQVMALTFDKADAVKKYVEAHHFEWPIVADAADLMFKKLGVTRFPSFILVNGEGRILEIPATLPSGTVEARLQERVSKYSETKLN